MSKKHMEMLLGMGFLQRHQAKIDLEQRKVELGPATVTLRSQHLQPPLVVRLLGSTTIGGGTEKLIGCVFDGLFWKVFFEEGFCATSTIKG